MTGTWYDNIEEIEYLSPMVQTEECCPPFDPGPWDGRTIVWQDKLFVKQRIKSFFHIPLNFGRVVTEVTEKIAAAGAEAGRLMPVDENSPWGADLYVSVSKRVPGTETVALSGTFLCKVFDGPYKNVPQWMETMRKYAVGEGKEIKKMYFWYTTCPECARNYGKNYVVLLAQV